MAYMNQERKSKIAPVVKAICKKYGVKASLSVRNHMTLCLNIKSGNIDFVGDYHDSEDAMKFGYIQVNPYWYGDHFNGKSKEFLKEVLVAMNEGNHDNSNSMIDYFDVGWYVDVNVGKWNESYQFTK
ncbi:hypothetical protein UFOVP257_274 [uncultured Caudovirales phage]|uniref:Uncharacterized protein n=1 Tax=uncultured Caudovirales phage TaxID=2100421 RepID=A0A6J5LJ15_9CAUD|nr:hypothetical protein UFOVP257_274 [uncultured Caudovirales phage]